MAERLYTPAYETPIDKNNFGNDKSAERAKQEEIKNKKKECIRAGGKWDATTQTCILPPPEPLKPSDVRAGETNRTADGEKVSKAEYDLALAKAQGASEGVRATRSPDAVQNEIARQDEIARLAKLTREGTLSPEQLQDAAIQTIGNEGIISDNQISNIATAGAAVGGAAIGAKSGAALGATIGSFIAPGVGTAVGGLIGGAGGAVVGAIGGSYAKLTTEKRQKVKEANKIFTQAKTNKVEILNMVNSGLLSPSQARELWQEEKNNILISRTYLKQQTQNDLTEFLGDSGDDLIAVESYLQLDYLYDLEFETALANPNPLNVRFPENGS